MISLIWLLLMLLMLLPPRLRTVCLLVVKIAPPMFDSFFPPTLHVSGATYQVKTS
jgi:hypothetical protein